MKDIIVLVTGAGAPGAPGIIKCLRNVNERKIKIIGVDANPESAGFSMVDEHYVVPLAKEEEFIDEVLYICKKEKVDVIIPLVTRELAKFSNNINLFREYNIKISVSPPEGLEYANNKFLLMKKCKDIGVPTPSFIKVDNYNDFKKAVFSLGYPQKNVCFKPPISNGMRGFRILSKEFDRFDMLINKKPMNVVTNLKEIEPILNEAEEFPDLIVMEYLPGKEYSVDVLVNEGIFKVAIPRLREKIKMGISFVGTTNNNNRIIDYSRKIVETLQLNGHIGLQFKEKKDGTPCIIESNPRVQGTIVLCLAAGINIVYLGVKLCLGEKITIPDIKWNTKMIRYWEEIYYDQDGHAYSL